MFQTEKRALRLNIAADVLFAVSAFGFALTTRSEAILLDGIYSLVTLLFAVVTWHVADLVMQPDSDKYPFGYVVYEPLVNLFKGLLLVIVAVYALFSAVTTLLSGGTSVHTELAFFYALGATAGCIGMAVYFRRVARKTRSTLVETDAKNWVIDAVLSAAVAFAFGLSWLLTFSGHTQYLNYVDPLVVAFLSLVVLPVPARIIRDNWAQIVARAPADELVEQINALIAEAAPTDKWPQREVRVQQHGRLITAHIYFIINHGDVREFDALRARLDKTLRKEFPYLALDVSFVGDEHWAYRATGDELPNS
ncbi:cation diffusion facilitator family transporter [Ruficoccus sp. ZRK36]|uniref:cation diffusion facilitator family transporter n=1 Tax=Ruficoccus sp. ZRK36 TaxID=2866311 RepID=UPI001C73AC25|nr:cation diffusion facilitator family transporter [Ruficoccus sp. ZRK36]QYY36909.1 cation diffusion facilitator family transporter [Ruficoccus sp. ZRK36]